MTADMTTLDLSGIEKIHTERLILKMITAETAKYIFASGTKDNIFGIFGLSSDDDYKRYKAQMAAGGNEYNSFRLFMIHDKNTGEFLGSCNFHTWKVLHSRAEIGYLIHEQYRRKGIAKEAMHAVLVHGFEHMQLNRVEAFLSPENEPSLRLVTHFGFTKEGLLREHYCKNGYTEDSACYSLLAREYQQVKTIW